MVQPGTARIGTEIFTLFLSTGHTDKSKVKILQNFVAFSKYMNFNINIDTGKMKILKEFDRPHCARYRRVLRSLQAILEVLDFEEQ